MNEHVNSLKELCATVRGALTTEQASALMPGQFVYLVVQRETLNQIFLQTMSAKVVDVASEGGDVKLYLEAAGDKSAADGRFSVSMSILNGDSTSVVDSPHPSRIFTDRELAEAYYQTLDFVCAVRTEEMMGPFARWRRSGPEDAEEA